MVPFLQGWVTGVPDGTAAVAARPRSCERSDPDSFGVGLLGIGLSSREAELDLLPLTPASAEPPYVAVRAAVPHVAGTDRDQGIPEPDRRDAASPRHGRSERDELGFGVLVALLLAADLLRRTFGSARVRGFPDVMTPEPDRVRRPDIDERAG
ncbi:hypothetical protein ACWD0J_10075 [Streptomyces sp. NPDC003011]